MNLDTPPGHGNGHVHKQGHEHWYEWHRSGDVDMDKDIGHRNGHWNLWKCAFCAPSPPVPLPITHKTRFPNEQIFVVNVSRVTCQADLSRLSCLCCPVPSVMSWPSCHGCRVLVVLTWLSCSARLVLSFPSWQYCPGSSIEAVLSCQYCPDYPPPAVLSWLSCHLDGDKLFYIGLFWFLSVCFLIPQKRHTKILGFGWFQFELKKWFVCLLLRHPSR